MEGYGKGYGCMTSLPIRKNDNHCLFRSLRAKDLVTISQNEIR